MGISQPLPFKLKKENQSTPGSSPLANKLTDFIPYASFYNEATILTKNGELMQTIKISTNLDGLPTEDVTKTGVYLRDAIRQALKQHITSADFSVYMHMHRTKTALEPLSAPTQKFAVDLQEEWLGKQHVGFSYQNVCYLTVLVSGESVKLFNIKEFQKSYRVTKYRRQQESLLQDNANRLDQAINNIQSDLSKYFVTSKLRIAPRAAGETGSSSEVYFSEQLEWLHSIMNLSEAPIAVRKADLSDLLATQELIFGFDALEVKHGKHKRFAALVSLKHYHELPAELFDRFLQMPVEIIVTQCFDFIPGKVALEEVKDIKDVLRRSKDGYIAHASGFLEMLEANQNHPTDFAEQQSTILIKTDHYGELDDITTRLQGAIAQMGLVSVREDIKLEECFWSQLPGNFEFIRRKHALPVSRVCGLARLNYFPTGKPASKWGEPITIMPTVTRTPYLFHFHEGNSGHTLVVDYNSFPDTLGYRLLHFFAAVSTKQTKRVVIFDRHGSAEMLAEAMDGSYLRMGGKQHNLALNPFAMEPVARNQGFLAAWVAALLNVDASNDQARAHIKTALIEPWNESEAAEGFTALVKRLTKQDPTLGHQLQSYMSLHAFGNTVASGMDNFSMNEKLTVVNLQRESFVEGSHFAVFALMLHRVILSLDGSPTLIVIKDAWDVLEHPFFASRLESLLEMLSEQNAVLLMSIRDIDRLQNSMISKDIIKLTPTKIFMPDDIDSDFYADIVGLSKAEDYTLLQMERQKGDLLIKHGAETIATRFKIDDPTLQTVLAGDAKALHGMRQK